MDARPTGTIVYERRRHGVARSEQARRLGLCGIDPARFGDAVDPAMLALLAPTEPVGAGVDLTGFVATGQTIRLERPLGLDQAFDLGGTLAVADDADGRTLVSTVALTDDHGRPAFSARATLFRKDPDAPAKARRAPPPSPLAGAERIGAARFTPEAVAAYAGPGINPIHVDPAAAAAAGFRAPIIAGTHGLHFLTAAAWTDLAARPVALALSFLRPIFWDDACDIVAATGPDGRRAFGLVRDDKPLVVIEIQAA